MFEDIKRKYTIWLKPELVHRIDALTELDNCQSRSEFTEKALRYYIGHLNSEDTTAFLSKALVSVLRGVLRDESNRFASLLFKLAVEEAMMMNVLASGLEISEADLHALRGRCVAEVKRTNGKISFDDAVDFQKGIAE